jgi:hypothetical protein
MTNILKEEASFNKYQSSQKTSALRRSHPFGVVSKLTENLQLRAAFREYQLQA